MPAGARRDDAALALVRAPLGSLGCSALLALRFAFMLIGPLANLALWSVAERWYTPFKLPVTYGTALLGGGVPADRRRDGVARRPASASRC